jgi:hypothetical protein
VYGVLPASSVSTEDLRAYWRLVRWLRRACDGVIPIHDLDPTPVSMRAT